MHSKKSNLIIVNYNGMIHTRSNELLENSITYQLKITKEKNIKGVLVSLKGAIYDNDSASVADMIKHLEKLNKRLGMSISIIEYSIDLFHILKKLTKRSKVKLFKNLSAANLFLNPKEFKEGMTVLVYDKDEENSKKLSRELSRYGYTVVRAKDANDFKTLVHKADYEIVITHSALNMDFSGEKAPKSVLALSKKLISNLPVFMDTAVETLVNFTGLEAQKSAHTVKVFDTKLEINIICAVMQFKGDIDGFFTLVFPTNIAVITMEALLGESVAEDDVETLKDGVGEFCNIITGSIKTVLSKKDIKMTFDLPKTYASLEETDGFIGHNNGIWIDMQLAGKPFYMFITK